MEKLDKVQKWRRLQQANHLEPPGKDLLIPHVPRDGWEQMLPGRSSRRTKDPTALSAPSDFSELLLLEQKSHKTSGEKGEAAQPLEKTRQDTWTLAAI